MVSSVLRCLIKVLAGCWHSCSICCILFGAVLWSLGPWGCPYQVVDLMSACVVLPCVCIVITLQWCGVVFLADCGSWHFVPPPPPNPNCSVYFYLFVFLIYCFFIHVFLYSAIWLLCDSAHWALGVGRFRLDCRLSRPIWCSSTSGCNCGFSQQVSQAHSLHLRHGH